MSTGLSRRVYQRQIPLFIVSVFAGILLILYFLTPSDASKAISGEIQQWGVILSTVTMIYASITIMVMHLRRLAERKENTRMLFNSSVMVGSFVMLMAIGLFAPGGMTGPLMDAVTTYILGYIYAGILTDWAYHPYTSYRRFRLTSAEATIMFISFLFVVLRNMTAVVVVAPFIANVGDWIAAVPAMATMRAALAAAGIGQLILGIRGLVQREPGLIELEMK
jgi:hypothetical protein